MNGTLCLFHVNRRRVLHRVSFHLRFGLGVFPRHRDVRYLYPVLCAFRHVGFEGPRDRFTVFVFLRVRGLDGRSRWSYSIFPRGFRRVPLPLAWVLFLRRLISEIYGRNRQYARVVQRANGRNRLNVYDLFRLAQRYGRLIALFLRLIALLFRLLLLNERFHVRPILCPGNACRRGGRRSNRGRCCRANVWRRYLYKMAGRVVVRLVVWGLGFLIRHRGVLRLRLRRANVNTVCRHNEGCVFSLVKFTARCDRNCLGRLVASYEVGRNDVRFTFHRAFRSTNCHVGSRGHGLSNAVLLAYLLVHPSDRPIILYGSRVCL